MSIFSTLLNFVVPGAGTVVDKVSDVVKEVTGKDDEQEAMKVLQQDPAAMAQVQERLSLEREEIEKTLTERLGMINATMRAELVAGNKWQKGWRPFNGYLYGISIFLCYPLPAILGKPVANVPPELWIVWGAVLGVQAHSRGKEKLTAMGNSSPGILQSVLEGIRK